MPMVTCRQCHSEVDSRLIACPTCGSPIGYTGGSPVIEFHPEVAKAEPVKLAVPFSSARRQQFQSPRFWATMAIVSLAITAGLNVLAIAANLDRLDLVDRLISNDPVTFTTITQNDQQIKRLSIFYLAALSSAALTFLVWIYRAHRNLRSFGATGLEYSPGWAVGGFFVPILNLGRPYRVMSEIWRASRGAGQTYWDATPVHSLLGPWWTLWIVSGLVGNLIFNFVIHKPQQLSQLRSYTYLTLVDEAILIPTALLACLLVWQFTRVQETANEAQAANPTTKIESVRTQLALAGFFVVTIMTLAFIVTRTGSETGISSAEGAASYEAKSRSSQPGGTRSLTLEQILHSVQLEDVLPGFRKAAPADLKLSNADLGLGTGFSEVTVYVSDAPSQLVVSYGTVAKGSLEIARNKASLRDEAYLERNFLKGFNGGNTAANPIKIQWTNPSLGDGAKLAQFRASEFDFEMLVFIKQTGPDAAIIFITTLRRPGVQASIDVLNVGQEAMYRICRDGGC